MICFSPHPDDDVISMGGTLIRLVEDQHEVHVAYMTSGNIAVFDHDARRVADLVTEFNRLFRHRRPTNRTRSKPRCSSSLQHKKPGQPDTPEVLAIKALIRWSEAKAAALVAGCQEEHLHFLDLPFYRTGTIAKKPITEEDVRIIRELIERLEPGADLRGRRTVRSARHAPRLCRGDFPGLASRCEAGGRGPRCCSIAGPGRNGRRTRSRSRCRSARTTWTARRAAIFRHESQKDSAMFPGPDDSREFWQRAEDRNRNTAVLYNQIGLPEYSPWKASSAGTACRSDESGERKAESGTQRFALASGNGHRRDSVGRLAGSSIGQQPPRSIIQHFEPGQRSCSCITADSGPVVSVSRQMPFCFEFVRRRSLPRTFLAFTALSRHSLTIALRLFPLSLASMTSRQWLSGLIRTTNFPENGFCGGSPRSAQIQVVVNGVAKCFSELLDSFALESDDIAGSRNLSVE